MAPAFSAEVRPFLDKVVVQLRGDLDVQGAAALQEVLAPLIADEDIDLIVLDLAGMTFCDSKGLSVVVGTYVTLRDQRRQLWLSGPNRATRHLLETTKLIDVIPVIGAVDT